jgi:23S rRNA pseudouridine2605 synthase
MAGKPQNADDKSPIRLQLYLARAGVGSRRACETYITSGRLTVNGVTVTVLGTKVLPEDTVTMDGSVVKPEQTLVYIALNKPQRYLCSNTDPEGRPLAVPSSNHQSRNGLPCGPPRLSFIRPHLLYE